MRMSHTQEILTLLECMYPDAAPALKFRSPYELLVAVILSAQCTDERVNKVTEVLFAQYNTPEKMLTLSQEELEKYIVRMTGAKPGIGGHLPGFLRAHVKGIVYVRLLSPGKGHRLVGRILQRNGRVQAVGGDFFRIAANEADNYRFSAVRRDL